MKKLGRSINAILKKYAGERVILEYEIQEILKEILKKHNVKPDGIDITLKGTALYIGVERAVLRQELAFYKSEILEKLQKHFGENKVKKVKFTRRPF